MTTTDAIKKITEGLVSLYEESEATIIAKWAVEHITGIPASQWISSTPILLSPKMEADISTILERLQKNEPIQYITEEAWFFGQQYFVNKQVLIPRPETEELVDWIIADYKSAAKQIAILDIGTGSGCIPITLQQKLPQSTVWSCDISEKAIQIAKKNAFQLKAAVQFLTLDFLDSKTREQLPSVDILVSNPPYIPEKDKTSMHSNVLLYEPAIALFVPDNDALVFYKAIASFGKKQLKKGGRIYLELHEENGIETEELFKKEGYHTELRKDMQQKNRLLKAGLD